MDPITAEFLRFTSTFDVFEWIGLSFLILIIGETIWDVVRGRRKIIGESSANFLIAVVNELLGLTVYGIVFILGLFVAAEPMPFSLPENTMTWALAVILADFTYYWMHRFEHEVRFFWAYHSVHHSSPEYNLTTALRLSWVEGLVEWVFFVPMLLLGFGPMQTLIAILVVVQYQTWIHTEKIGRLGWLDKIFNTPSTHRVHHGANPQYIDKNYGGIFIVWDRIFGTYEPEQEKVEYGLTKAINTINPVKVNFYEYGGILRDMRHARSLKEGIRYCFGRPGWKPEIKVEPKVN